MNEFLSFRTMITSNVVSACYVFGVLGLAIAGLRMLVYPVQPNDRLIGLAVIVGGNLAWRVACEIVTVLFSIHDRLGTIERNSRR